MFWKQQREKSDITRMKVEYKLKIYSSPIVKSKNLPDHPRSNEPNKVAFLEFSLSSKKKSPFPVQTKQEEKRGEVCIFNKLLGQGGIARIELATSCTLSKNHTTRPNARILFVSWKTRVFLHRFSWWQKWRYSVSVGSIHNQCIL